MVYADKTTQNEVFSMLNNTTFDYYAALQADNLSIVKESITKVYTVSLLEYAKSGVLQITPMTSGNSKDKEGNVYIAKVITEEKAFAGNIRFYVENDTAYTLLFSPSPVLSDYYAEAAAPQYIASCSYADHAKRIQGMLQRNKLVSVNDVKYVIIDGVGESFFVNDSNATTLIPVGYISETKSETTDVKLAASDLSALAAEQLNMYNKWMPEKQAWESEHPGEKWSFTEQYVSPIVSGISSIDNIENIYDYLGISHNDVSVAIHATDMYIWGIITISCFIVFTAAVVGTKRLRKPRKR